VSDLCNHNCSHSLFSQVVYRTNALDELED
jgi:hypothetical protein